MKNNRQGAEPLAAAEPLVPVEPATVTPEQLKELKERAAKADENWDRLLRTTADFDNFKKRAAREKQEAIKYRQREFAPEAGAGAGQLRHGAGGGSGCQA